jgi:aldehyde:ferredoxin oxidoreductase
MFGYTGKLLFVDLTSGTSDVRALDEAAARNFIGGPALGAKILYDKMPAHADVFGPESMIGFVSGPTNGTGAFLGGRYTVVSKSPVTGGWNDTNSGGNFGPLMKKSGFDAIFVRGVSARPVYIFVDNGRAELRDASHLWGKTVSETEKLIREELKDQRVGIAMIGPAGEHRSHMAAVMNDTHRAAGRGGSGAVMGSKKLKAVVVRGDCKIAPKDKDALVALNRETVAWEKEGPVAPVVNLFSNHGTAGSYESSIYGGDTSVKNWAGSSLDLTEEQIMPVTSQAMDQRFKKKKYACNACSIGCGAIYGISRGKWPLEETARPEYETQGMFGSQLLNGSAEAVNKCTWLCNEYGFDTISMGGTVAWCMENYSNGIFTREELDGIDLHWGNADAIVEITEKICRHEGVGKALSNGSLAAAKHFNKGFGALVVAGGIEIPQHDPRFAPGLARTYKYDPTPGRHVKGGLGIGYGNEPPEVKHNYSGTGERDVAGVVRTELTNAAGFCLFGDFGLPPGAVAKYLAAVTGFEYNEEEFRMLGLRSFTMRHAFNLREGLQRKDFEISGRIVGSPPLQEGPNAGVTVDVERLADSFYAALGWNITDGIPRLETLKRVGGLENAIRDLYPDVGTEAK